MIHLLCLSTGNADGLGDIREEELENVADFLGFTYARTIDHSQLPDGMNNKWNRTLVATLVYEYVMAHNITAVITFDNRGVSGHPNHIDVHHGVILAHQRMIHEAKVLSEQRGNEAAVLLYDLERTPPRLYYLQSVNLIRKFTGIFDQIPSLLTRGTELFVQWEPSLSWQAMKVHKSQFVWFRKLFVIFSRYTYTNTLIAMGDGTTRQPVVGGCFTE
jgi:N-acetylglucosaminylphosphatidylinositol deacetylase